MNLHRKVVSLPTLLFPWLLLLSSSIAAQSNSTPQDVLETARYHINGVTLVAEIADEVHERRAGLSFRSALEPNHGMLFVFARERELVFTMQNASIPLSIAFINADMTILEILPMTPFTRGPYPSSKPAQFALEMNQGWFERNNIKPGDKLSPD